MIVRMMDGCGWKIGMYECGGWIDKCADGWVWMKLEGYANG